mmetsp:Transcript_12721/g.34672  ORF Transcript_12721/g.34672 Transcript_12721/m.34672 type:complete len:295 (+) Transcript_12721:188-1072(+)
MHSAATFKPALGPASLPLRTPPRLRRRLACRSSPEQDVARLRGGDRQDNLAEETSAQVADIVDTDRTGELLLWVFQSLFGRKEEDRNTEQKGPEPAQSTGMTVEHEAKPGSTEVAVFGGGCYWTTDAIFRRVKGVKHVVAGFGGSEVPNPSYKQVCSGATGHAEVVQVEFDPRLVSFRSLLDILGAKLAMDQPKAANPAFFKPQYRPIVLCTSDTQQREAESFVQELQHQQELKIIPEVTRLEGARKFWPSNARHQNFYETNPTNCYCLNEIMPALRRLKQQYPSTVSSDEVCT